MSRIDATVMDHVAGLRLIQQWGVGLEGVDIVAATARGITVATSPRPDGQRRIGRRVVRDGGDRRRRRLPELKQVIRYGTRWGGPAGRALWGETAASSGWEAWDKLWCSG